MKQPLTYLFGSGQEITVWFSPKRLDDMISGEWTGNDLKMFLMVIDKTAKREVGKQCVVLGVAEVDIGYKIKSPLMDLLNKSDKAGMVVAS